MAWEISHFLSLDANTSRSPATLMLRLITIKWQHFWAIKFDIFLQFPSWESVARNSAVLPLNTEHLHFVPQHSYSRPTIGEMTLGNTSIYTYCIWMCVCVCACYFFYVMPDISVFCLQDLMFLTHLNLVRLQIICSLLCPQTSTDTFYFLFFYSSAVSAKSLQTVHLTHLLLANKTSKTRALTFHWCNMKPRLG